MGFVKNLLGMGGGTSGTGFKATGPGGQPTSPIVNPASVDQANQLYGQVQSGLGSQANFLNALSAQNMGALGGQNALAGQLQGVANGTGPNPALAQLANTTGQNIASQAALAAGQRGSGANAGLLARQIGQQGAGIQQNAAGQAAALQAQQQLSALGQLQNLYGTQVGQQQAGLQGYNQAAQSAQQNLLNAIAQQNQANVAAQNNINSVGGTLANTTQNGQQGLFGGALSGLSAVPSLFAAGPASLGPAGEVLGSTASGGTAAGAGASLGDFFASAAPAAAAALAKGGVVKKYADGGTVDGPQSAAGRFLYGSAPSQQSADQMNPFQTMAQPSAGSSGVQQGASKASSGILGGIGSAVKGIGSVLGLKEGGHVPGKARVGGDSLKNDTVPAMLSPGEIVLPRHITQSEDPVGNSAKFVQAIMAKHGMRRKS